MPSKIKLVGVILTVVGSIIVISALPIFFNFSNNTRMVIMSVGMIISISGLALATYNSSKSKDQAEVQFKDCTFIYQK